jgi:gas vesicle protein
MRDDKANGLNMVGAALVGALVGAGVALMTQEEKRQEIKKKMAEVIATGEEKIDAIMGKVEDLSVSQRRRLLKRMENVRRKGTSASSATS